MKTIMLIILLAVGLVCSVQALPPLPECYHTYAEVTAELQQIASTYSDIAKLSVIGYSTQDNLPIYALKISNDVIHENPEPSVLFIGQVHAEEVLGVEVTMSNINEILSHRYQTPYISWINQLEMWFIPTINPEGHNVVTSGMDPSFRKNKRDVDGDGVFTPSPLVGYDIDGVDINRNFAFNWVHGDTLLTPASASSPEAYDYYRGAYPMSETEPNALKAFCDVQKPVFAIVWHSSRNPASGLYEGVFYPMNWYDVRPAPDLALGQQIGEAVAGVLIKQAGGTYEPSASKARKGDINNYLYKEYGTICLVIECGTNDIQPIEATMLQVVDRCTEGSWWLLNRALPTPVTGMSKSMLTGTIKDAVTLLPLEAEVIIDQKQAPWFGHRKSDPITGRYWRPTAASGQNTLRFVKKGYFDKVYPSQTIAEGSWTTVNPLMVPRPAATITGSVHSFVGNQPIQAQIILFDVENDTLQTNGSFQLNTYEGSHRIEVTSDGYYPYITTLEIAPGVQSISLNISLTPVEPINVVFSEDWENGMSNWSTDPTHTWVIESELAANGHAITDSWGGKGFYAQNCNVWIKTNNPITIPDVMFPMLVFDEHLYTEFVYDSVRVEISTNNTDWQTIYSNSGQYDWWHPVYIPLTQLPSSTFFLRFRLTDISTHVDLTDPGWTIDNIRVIMGSSAATITPNSEEIAIPPVTALYPNFPNPFNPETNIKFSNSQSDKISIDIYNIKGQRVKQLTNQAYPKGTHSLKWNGMDENGKSVSSGIYFCKMYSVGKTQMLKMVLMK